MPSGVSDYGSSTWLKAMFGVTPVPKTYWIALCSDEPGAAMDGDILADLEPTDPQYSRQPYGTGAANWDNNGQYLTNLQDLVFPLAAADWGYLTHFALCTAPFSGDMYAWGELLNPQFITDTVGVLIPAGAMVLGLHALDNSISA